MRQWLASLLVLAGFIAASETLAADLPPRVIASGEVSGYYFPSAGALCRVLNKERPGGKGCVVLPSSGSAANLAALRSGEADLAIVQARAAALALQGREPFKTDGPFQDLKALASLHGESVLLLTRQEAGIRTVADLKGKRVNLGRQGSFQRGMATAVLESQGVSEGDLATVVELDLDDQAVELCEGNIDAAFFSGVHPMAEALEAIEECDAWAVPVELKSSEAFLKRSPWYSPTTIRKGTYASLKDDLPTLQMKALIVTTDRLPADEAKAILKAMHANFGAFTRLHPVLKGLSKAATAREGFSIPRHEGAEKFYAETDLK